MENTTATTHSLLDSTTRSAIERYFEAEPAAVTVTLESRSITNILMGVTVVGRDGSARYFEAEREAEAAWYAEAKGSEIIRSRK